MDEIQAQTPKGGLRSAGRTPQQPQKRPVKAVLNRRLQNRAVLAASYNVHVHVQCTCRSIIRRCTCTMYMYMYMYIACQHTRLNCIPKSCDYYVTAWPCPTSSAYMYMYLHVHVHCTCIYTCIYMYNVHWCTCMF